MNTQPKARKKYIDIAKGIGIIFVVIGHCPYAYNSLTQWIYAFHMPLFFVISGMVWNRVSHEKRGYFNKSFLFDKIKRLVIPCYIWGFAYMLVNAVRSKIFSPLFIAYLLYGSQSGFSHAGSLSSLWFMTCMFLAVCAFELIQMANKKDNIAILAIISSICAIVSFFLPHIKGGYPWNIDVVFIAISFMICGYLVKELIEKLNNKLIITAIAAATIVFLTLTYRLNLHFITTNNVDMAGRHFGNAALYLFDALLGSIGILLVSRLLNDCKLIGNFFAYLGKRTIPIFITHKPIVNMIGKLTLTMGLPSLLVTIGSVVISIIFGVAIYEVIVRFCPIVFGEDAVATKKNKNETA